MQNGGVRKP